MKPGVYPDLSEEAYHGSPGVSASFLKKMRRSAAHAQVPDAGETKDRCWYHLVHRAILEPTRLEKDYQVIPATAFKRPLKVRDEYKGKIADDTLKALDWWEAFDADRRGRIQIDQEDFDAARFVRDNAFALAGVRELLEDGIFEASFFAADPVTGLPTRARPDCLSTRRAVVDVKNCSDAREFAFNRQIGQMGYHVQIAHYREVVREAKGTDYPFAAFIAVEDSRPFAVAYHAMDDDWMAQGMKERRKLLNQYKACVVSGIWPAYPDQMGLCRMPKYYGEEKEAFYTPVA